MTNVIYRQGEAVGNESLTPAARRWWLFRKRILPITLTYMGLTVAPFCFSISGLAVALLVLIVTGMGVTVGLHRLLTHRSFKTYRWAERVLATVGALAFQGGVVDWVAIHRMHHAHSDTVGDPHTPKDCFWKGYFLWLFHYDPRVAEPSLRTHYVRDLCKDPYIMFLEDWSIGLQMLLFFALYLVGAFGGPELGLSWAVYGVFVRAAVLQQIAWLINSVSHTWGYRNFQTKDQSVNCWWLTLPSLGEGWHNNHHAFPQSARFGLSWYELDLGFLAIRALQAVHLAWDVVVPGPDAVHREARPRVGQLSRASPTLSPFLKERSQIHNQR